MSEERRRGEPFDDAHLGDDVVGLVLGQIDGQRRAAMAAHLLSCAACRREYDEIAAAVNDVLPIVPGVQPPIGFDERVLELLGTTSTGRGHRPRRRRVWLAGAAAMVLALVGLSVGWWAATRATDEASAAVAPLELSSGGGPVGTVSVRDVDGEAVMVVAITEAPDGVTYSCRTTFTDGSTVDAEPWPSGTGAWIVPLPSATAEDIAAVELLVSGTDHVWSVASFGDMAT